jgi:hypothetical protein
MPKKFRWFLIVALVIFFGFALADSQGVFDKRPYYEVPHGDHTHYVPKDCDPPLPVSNAPQRPPGPNERIDCTGQIVPQ